MARIKHIALTTKEPATVAEFYKNAFGLKELRRSNGNVFLTDGHIHVAVLKTKGEAAPDMGAHGPHFAGVHHFGFEVDDLGRGRPKAGGGARATADRKRRSATPRCGTAFTPISSRNGPAPTAS